MSVFTTLNKSDTHSKGLKSTVPATFVKMFGLEKGSRMSWNVVTIVEGKIIENTEGDEGKKKNRKPETVMIVRRIQEENGGTPE